VVGFTSARTGGHVNDLLRTIRTTVFAIATASLLASCRDEGGVSDAFFWMHGAGDCSQVTATIDLERADAVLGPGIEGEQECSLYYILENNGCDIDVDPIDSGRLRVIVSGCRIGDITGLFRCGFSDGDLLVIAEHTTAICDCFGPRCDETPPLCVSDDDQLSSCEVCDNGTDDDGDGLADCDDNQCENYCGISTTTSTSTTDSHGLSTSTTTSTTLAEPPAGRYAVKFGLENGAGIGAIEFDIDYAAIGALAAARARAVLSGPDCVQLVESSLATFEYDEQGKIVHVSVTNLSGAAGPAELVECTFEATEEPSTADFDVDVIQALNLQGNPVGSPPPVQVGDIKPVTTTTTLDGGTTTTTTIGEVTTTTSGVTTTTLPIPFDVYAITFHLDSASASIGALQWRTSYGAATGGFAGSGAGVSCTNLVSQTLFAPNDKETVCSEQQSRVCSTNADCTNFGTCSVVVEDLVLGLISLDSFSAPIDLVRCTFNGTASDPPVPGDFSVVIEDATDAAGEPVSASISVNVSVP
jgi:hypothetical protein